MQPSARGKTVGPVRAEPTRLAVCCWMSSLDARSSRVLWQEAPPEQTARNFSPDAGKFSPFRPSLPSMPSAAATSAALPALPACARHASRHRLCCHVTRQGFFSDQSPLVVHARSRSCGTGPALGARAPDDHGLPVRSRAARRGRATRRRRTRGAQRRRSSRSCRTVFRDTSELSRINREAAAAPARASEELFALLTRCQTLHAETDGAFDITSTPLSRRWGFLKSEDRQPAGCGVDAPTAVVGMNRAPRSRDAHRVVRRGGHGVESRGHRQGPCGRSARRRAAAARRDTCAGFGRRQQRPGRWRRRKWMDGSIDVLTARFANRARATSGCGVGDERGRRTVHRRGRRAAWTRLRFADRPAFSRRAERKRRRARRRNRGCAVDGIPGRRASTLLERDRRRHPQHWRSSPLDDSATTHVFGSCNGAQLED